jgi:RNA polymerase sigma-70 factor (ECF subfamily)
MPDEKHLIEKASQGDKAAFTALVRQYQNRIFAFIMRMTANRESALDLTQDTFLAAYQNLAGFRKEASFSTWLFTIAANKTRNYLRRSSREIEMPEGYDVASDDTRPDIDFEKKQTQELLLAAVAGLPVKQRAVFNLRYFEQLKFHEIARIQGTSVSAVKTNFAEALVKLKKKLGGR